MGNFQCVSDCKDGDPKAEDNREDIEKHVSPCEDDLIDGVTLKEEEGKLADEKGTDNEEGSGSEDLAIKHIASLAGSDAGSTCSSSAESSDVSMCESEAEDEVDPEASLRIRRKSRRRVKRELKMVNTMGFIPSAALLVVPDSRGVLEDNYDVEDGKNGTLGQGGFAVVKRASVRVTGAKRAVKIISKSDKNNPGLLKAEIEIMKMLDHPNVVTLFEIFEDKETLSLVLELCNGGQLEKYVEDHGVMKETEAALTMKQILRALYYLHSINICHRDIKAANALIVVKGELDLSNDVKLSDFGLSTTFRTKVPLTQRCGTPSHMAPEVFNKNYTKQCDVWSCGCMLYWLLSQQLPFGKVGLSEENARAKLSFTGGGWVDTSQECVSLVTSMLSKSVALRIKPDQALKHAWIKMKTPKPQALLIEQAHVDSLLNYRSLNKFRRACLNMTACMLGEADVGPSRRLFNELDENGDGLVSMKELVEKVHKAAESKKNLRPKSLQKKEAEKIFSETGISNLKDFTYTEFVAATFNRKRLLNERLGRVVFQSFDKNGDGSIDLGELAGGQLLGHLRADELVQTLKDLDVNGDGELDFEEFMAMCRS
eukprot:TRINITY_DN39006_c0_g1_i1.p1 TRINITY_DN39006_c0_g1~~TRINITY_DN39006_c0_g1_i1.p1  ORF type:complete len:607 (+),score=125.64 TRINITY_DN39006_c0_g1_i1:29-1822(+)